MAENKTPRLPERVVTQTLTLPKTMSFLRLAARSCTRPRLVSSVFVVPRLQNRLPPRANFAAAAGLSKDEIQSRVLDVLKGFEKVDPAKVCFAAIPSYGQL